MNKMSMKCPSCNTWILKTLSECPYCKFKLNEQGVPPEKDPPQPGPEKTPDSRVGRIISKIKKSKNKPSDVPATEGHQQADEPDIDRVPKTEGEDVEPDTIDVEEIPKADQKTPNQGQEKLPVATPLAEQVGKIQKTRGKYVNPEGETVEPVVGWLVGVKGDSFGMSFPVRGGRNKIGRSNEMDVKLLNDSSVSRQCVAQIIYDPRGNKYYISPGDSSSLCYLNGEYIDERSVLTEMDEIEFGDAGLNKYVFMPLCGERFVWSNYSKEKD